MAQEWPNSLKILSGRIIGETPMVPQEQTWQCNKSATAAMIVGCY